MIQTSVNRELVAVWLMLHMCSNLSVPAVLIPQLNLPLVPYTSTDNSTYMTFPGCISLKKGFGMSFGILKIMIINI